MHIDKIRNGFLVIANNYGIDSSREYAPTIESVLEKVVYVLTGKQCVVETRYKNQEETPT